MNEITGTSGDDSLSGSLADETIKGSGGEDTITGGDGNDVIYGGYGGTLNLGTLSYSFGGEYVDDDYQINSLEIPNTVQSGDRFWVVIHDHVYTKAIQLEVHDLGGGDFSLQVVDAKYDTETVFSSIDGDFQAIQDHFNSSGNWMPTVESLSGYGYGLHNISVDGVSYSGFLSTTSPTTFSRPDDAADSIDGGLGNDTIYGELGNDTIDGGGGDDLINGGVGDDLMTGGSGDDTFELASPGTEAGHNTITDFNTGNSGAIDDGDQSNNDLVDLSAYYNETTLAAWNAANPTQQYANPIAWMRADQNDDGVLNASEAGWTALAR